MPHSIKVELGFQGNFTKPLGSAASFFLSNGSGLAVGSNSAPFIYSWPWSQAGGYGTKFANPATALAMGTIHGTNFGTNGLNSSVIFVTGDLAPFIVAYAWDKVNGFGSKFADPAAAANSAGEKMIVNAITGGTANYHIGQSNQSNVAVWNFSKAAAGWGTKFAVPVGNTNGLSQGADFSPSGRDIGWGITNNPFQNCYPWSAAGFGTRYAAPATPPTQGHSFRFSKTGGSCLISGQATPPLSPLGYVFTSGVGYGSKFAGIPQPAIWQDETCNAINTKSGAVVAGFAFGATYKAAITVWPFSDTGFGAASYTQQSVTPNTSGLDAAFSQAGKTVFAALGGGSAVIAYPWSDVFGFSTKYADPVGGPTVAFSIAVAV